MDLPACKEKWLFLAPWCITFVSLGKILVADLPVQGKVTYSHHGSSAAEIFPQTSTNGTSESACRIVVSWCLHRCNQQWHNSVVPHHNKNDTEQNCHTTMQHLTNNGFRTTKKHPGLGSMYANEWVHAFFCCFIMLLPFPLSRPMLASINFQFSQNTYPKKILAHVILHIVHKWWKCSNVMWTRFQSYS